jgi:signal recognition particle GTPase
MKAVVKRLFANPNEPRKGYVTPLYTWNDQKQAWDNVLDPETEFPNRGTIFIEQDYDKLGTEDFDFCFLTYTQTDNYRPDSPNSAKFISSASQSSGPADYEFCEIIERQSFNPVTEEYSESQADEVASDILAFIKKDEYLYGPFIRKIEKGRNGFIVKFLGLSNNILDLPVKYDHVVFQFNLEEIHLEILNLGGDQYVYNAKILIQKYAESASQFYFQDVEELLEWGRNALKLSKLQEQTFSELKPLLIGQAFIHEEDKKKMSALLKRFDKVEEWITFRLPEFAARYLNETENGKRYLDEYFETNKSKIFAELNQEIFDIERTLEDKKIELNNLSSEQIIFGNLDNGQREVIKGIIQDPEKIEINKNLMDVVVELRSTEKILLGKKNDKDDLERNISDLQKAKTNIENSFAQLTLDFKSDQTVSDQLLRLKTYTEILNGISANNGNNKNKLTKRVPRLLEHPISATEYISEIQARLETNQRILKFNDLSNIIITIAQNFLTIFAGLPGVGKTSLITKLAEAQGMQDFFRPVSVARGWTSGKDLVGFFNPLSSSFQPAPTGVYDLIRDGSTYSSHQQWILLDEANLSPMEHYWSDFMRFSDSESTREVQIRESAYELKNYSLSNSLRFIGTINYDHTTEVLSPRLIDRAPVIILDPPPHELNIPMLFSESISTEIEEMGYSRLKELFIPTRAELSREEKGLLDQILNILQNDDIKLGLPVVISPRKIKAIFSYVTTGREVLNSDSNQFTALDYAVLQNVLPLLDGHGESFKARLHELGERMKQLPLSSTRLKRIISYGSNNYDNFRFFC